MGATGSTTSAAPAFGGLCRWLRDEVRSAALLLLLVAAHGLTYPAQFGLSYVLAVNVTVLLLAVYFVWMGVARESGLAT